MTEPVLVRPATLDDLPAMADLLEAVAAEGRWIGREPPVDRAGVLESWTRRLTAEDHASFVAVIGDTVAGYINVRGDGPSDIGMLVATEHRGRGIGRALLEASVAWARSVGSHKLTLQVWPHNEAAIALYERFGFVREGYLRRQWRRASGEIWDSVVMGLILDDPGPEPGSAAPH